jgi:hypothetical protein
MAYLDKKTAYNKQDSERSAMPVPLLREPSDEFPIAIGIELHP